MMNTCSGLLIPHLEYFNSIPSASLPLSHPLFFPNVPTMLPRRNLPEWSQGHSCSLSKVNPTSQGGSRVLHEAAPPQCSCRSQHITLNSITTVHTPCCLLDKEIKTNLEKWANSIHRKPERLGLCWARNTAKNQSSVWLLFPRRGFKKFKDTRASVGKDGVTYLKYSCVNLIRAATLWLRTWNNTQRMVDTQYKPY